jgi:tetratricopeptide (TPR) repeat protein
MTRTLLSLFLLPFSLLFAQENLQQAMKLVASNDPDGARKILENVVARNDADSEVHFQLGKLLFEHYRNLDAAEEQLERAVDLADNRADYHFTLGRVYGAIAQDGGVFTGMRYAGKVKTEFVRAVELGPDSVMYRAGLMRYYLRAPAIVGGSVSKAREQADAVLRLDAYEGHMSYAEIAASEKDEQTAETEYKAAIAVNPKKPQAYFRLGYHYFNQKRIDDAILQFREYVRYAPDDPNSHDSLGEGLLEKGNYDEALLEYGKAVALNPRFNSAVYGMARCYEGKGMKSAALSSYQNFLALDPKGETADIAKGKIEELQK